MGDSRGEVRHTARPMRLHDLFLAASLALCGCADQSPGTAPTPDPAATGGGNLGDLDPVSFDTLTPRPPLDAEGPSREAGTPGTGSSADPSRTPAPELGGEAVGRFAESPTADEAGGGQAGDQAGGDAVALDDGLTRAVESAVAKALDRARKATKGKVHGANTTVSVMAIDASTGRILVQRLAEHPLVPASNLKLMTAAAGLAVLGADGAFVTPFLAVGEIGGGVLEGDLVVVAGGDPLHRRDGDGALDPWLDPLAEALIGAGIQRVAGALVLDEGGWLKPGPGPRWPAKEQYWRDYCALAAGFTANGGCFRATVTPTSEGERASVVLRPRDHGLTRKGTVQTSGKRVVVNVGANASGVTVRGKIRADARPYTAEFSHPDPVELFGHALVGGLARRGIEVSGGFRRAEGVSVEGARLVHTIRTPISSVMEAILLDSNNAVADQLFLATGASVSGAGTREAGAKAVREALQRLGLNVRPLVQVDGSGLSKANRATTQQLSALVAAVIHQGGEMRGAILNSLPVAGRSGKLVSRMRGTVAEGRVRAKTGWVKGASGLSGVAETVGGAEVVFSILVGYPLVDGVNTAAWKPMQDDICVAFAGWKGGGETR